MRIRTENSDSNGAVSGGVAIGSDVPGKTTFASPDTPQHTHEMATVSRAPQINGERREKTTRRSGRFREVLDRVYEQPEAELVLDLNNIRKKLNFKTNSIDDGERPAKRQKRDTVRCHCHLTIWDNRDGFAAIPLTTKSSICRVTGTDNGVHGHFVDVELEKPFIIKADEIRVAVTRNQSTELEIIDKYFLEVKIIPCRADNRWPPMPILGKSDGDHFARDIKKTGSEELQGAIVARYTHLPTAPENEVPLSVFFLHEGKTYRTKYGLQVTSTWQKAGAGPINQNGLGLDLDSFRSEQTESAPLVNGIKKQDPQPPEEKPLKKSPPQKQPEISYNFSGRMSEKPDIAQEFRNAIVQGYCCPLCGTKNFAKLQYLQFHLKTLHPKYNFSVQKPHRDPVTNELVQIQIKVEQNPPVPVKKEENYKSLTWMAPNRPFDLKAYVSGDNSWTEQKVSAKPYIPSRPRAQYPQAKDVPDFRYPNRKKLKAIKLETKYTDDEPERVYTSVSHRPVSPTEDARSETDDEIDNEWQIATHMERLDLISKQENWSEYKRELTKRWDRHRMEEQLEHSVYLSNSLIRFARKQREWLRSSDHDELLQCFFEFLGRLKHRRVIDDNVIADVNELIFQDPLPVPQLAKRGREKDWNVTEGVRTRSASASVARAARFNRTGDSMELDQDENRHLLQQTDTMQPVFASATLTCLICTNPITHAHIRRDVTYCADPTCTTPLRKYHKSCTLALSATSVATGLETGDPKSSKKGKEKATTAPSFVSPRKAGDEHDHDGENEEDDENDDANHVSAETTSNLRALKSWSCAGCILRWKEKIQAREEEKEEKRRREKQMVEMEAVRILGTMV